MVDKGGRILVKLKLPKMEDDDDELKAVEKKEEDLTKKSHYCADCNRSFSSGKALGGHMSSAHVQANKELSLKKLKSKLKKHSMGSNSMSNLEEIICNICGKDFPSRKSIFGHMRCHPDRDWRGMEPPRSRMKIIDNNNDSVVETEDLSKQSYDHEEFDDGEDHHQVVDLMESLKSWSVTGKRGRGAVYNRDTDPEENRELLDAVHQLIRLVNDDWGKRKIEENNSIEPELSGRMENRGSAGLIKKPKICEESGVNDDEKNKLDATKIDDNHGKKEATLLGKRAANNCRLKTPKKVKMAMDLDDEKAETELDNVNNKRDSSFVIEPTPPTGKFSCSICKKRFTTHQALGGHRSSHNKFKISIYNTSDQHKNIQESQNTTTTTITNAVDDGNLRLVNVRKGIDFDLNEMPDAEDIEDGVNQSKNSR